MLSASSLTARTVRRAGCCEGDRIVRVSQSIDYAAAARAAGGAATQAEAWFSSSAPAGRQPCATNGVLALLGIGRALRGGVGAGMLARVRTVRVGGAQRVASRATDRRLAEQLGEVPRAARSEPAVHVAQVADVGVQRRRAHATVAPMRTPIAVGTCCAAILALTTACAADRA
jgi:hypothetical protein